MSGKKQLRHMSREVFDENKQAILVDLNALMDNPKSRRLFRLLAVYDKGSNQLLAEVFALTQGTLVVHRGRGHLSRVKGRASGVFVRQDRGDENLIVAPLTDDPDQFFVISVGRMGDRSLSGRDLTRWLAEGKTRHSISEPSEDNRHLSETAQLAKYLADNVDAIAARPDAGEFARAVDQMYDDIIGVLNQD